MRPLLLLALAAMVGMYAIASALTYSASLQHERRVQAETKPNIYCDAQCQADNHSREAY